MRYEHCGAPWRVHGTKRDCVNGVGVLAEASDELGGRLR